MSFVCEKCGTRDDPHWRNRYFDPHAQIMEWQDFQRFDPSLSKRLEWGSWVRAGPYVYRVTRDPKHKRRKFVVRLTFEEFEGRHKSVSRPKQERRGPDKYWSKRLHHRLTHDGNKKGFDDGKAKLEFFLSEEGLTA